MLLDNFIVAQAASKVREVATESLPGLIIKDDIYCIGHEYLRTYGHGTLLDLEDDIDHRIVNRMANEVAAVMAIVDQTGCGMEKAAQVYAVLSELKLEV